MSVFCGFCCDFRPRYKGLVDLIFPKIAEDGLVNSQMEVLTYYAATSPEKLDRIGEYLAGKIGRDIYRNRIGFVTIGMEAMNILLKSCHAQSLNLYVESYLKTLQKLLETPIPNLQILASQSFFQFSKISEDTPSYHRTYDFFIDRFSQMCHNNTLNGQIQMNGLLGLNGVVRKTVNEDLAENIWESKHMDKIIPSLLLNMKNESQFSKGEDEDQPHKLAEQLLRELVKASSFSSIKVILSPVLIFMDEHEFWNERDFPFVVQTFEAIMYSIQVDLSYIVIEALLNHLDVSSSKSLHLSKSSDMIKKVSNIRVLAQVIGIGVGGATVGPSVLEIINTLLKHYKKSLLSSSDENNFHFQEALLQALGEYVRRLPDFQMVEIMSFILSKVSNESTEIHLTILLLKALYVVAEKYTSHYLTTTFSPQFLTSLLKFLTSSDPDVRIVILQIFQTLLDRHENVEKFMKPFVRPVNLGLNAFPDRFTRGRADELFTQKTLFYIYSQFKRTLEESNTIEYLEAMFTTCALLVYETAASDEGTIYVLDFIESLQENAISNGSLSRENKFSLHALSICLLSVLAITISPVPELDSLVERLIQVREEKAEHLLPPFREESSPIETPLIPENEFLIFVEPIKKVLTLAGKNMDSFTRPESPVFHTLIRNTQKSCISSNSIDVQFSEEDEDDEEDENEEDTSDGNHASTFKSDVDISVSSFKKLLLSSTSTTKLRDEEEKLKVALIDKFKTLSFYQLTEMTSRQPGDSLSQTLETILSQIQEETLANKISEKKPYSILRDPTPYDTFFPELFT